MSIDNVNKGLAFISFLFSLFLFLSSTTGKSSLSSEFIFTVMKLRWQIVSIPKSKLLFACLGLGQEPDVRL